MEKVEWSTKWSSTREELGAASLLHTGPHGLHHLHVLRKVILHLHHLRNALFHLAEHLVVLGLVVLDEVTSLPGGVAHLTERLGLQAQLGLDNGAFGCATAQNAPHHLHVDGRSIIQSEESWGQVEIVDLAVLHIAHAWSQMSETLIKFKMPNHNHRNQFRMTW